MNCMELKYGCNPNQSEAKVFMADGGDLPFTVLNGKPSYINLMDALNGWQLVQELAQATGLPAAASFKHVSPAGAAVAVPLSKTLGKIYFTEDEDLTPMATAYIRARGADRMSSYGDFVALSHTCDVQTAKFLAREVSDGIIAPAYEPEALEILKAKKKGNYLILQMDGNYKKPALEKRTIYGITFQQASNDQIIDHGIFHNIPTINKDLPEEAKRDLIIALITLKYTQSNSVCYAKDGQAIGIGAGQQSRIHCTRLAGQKADVWHLRQAPEVLNLPFKDNVRRAERDNAIDVYITEENPACLAEGNWQELFNFKPMPFAAAAKKAYLSKINKVSLASDAFFPFGDNIERAHASGVEYVAQAGGSLRDDQVIATCDKYNMVMAMIGFRLFHH